MSTTTTVSFEEVAAFIGAASREEVDIMSELLRTRSKTISKVMSSLNASVLKEGDHVRICGNISPKYLVGQTAVVFGPSARGKRGFLAVKLDQPIGKWSNLTPIDFPASCLAKVD